MMEDYGRLIAQTPLRTEEAWWDWHDQNSERWSVDTDEAERRCSAWVAGESDDGPQSTTMTTKATTTYTVHAGNSSTDLGRVGWASTLLGAKRIGRAAVRDMLPNGEGSYVVRDIGRDVAGEERSLRTGFKWAPKV